VTGGIGSARGGGGSSAAVEAAAYPSVHRRSDAFAEPRTRTMSIVLAALLLLVAIAWVRSEPPAARGFEAPATAFSAMRARDVLRRLVGDGVPHPVGSQANALLRTKIAAELTGLGYAPEVREEFVCGEEGSCAFVHNVVARAEGREPGKAVLLVAHYDSVAAGPGAADNGAGVAVMLEIARALAVRGPLRRPTIFLFDDAEEAGLLGALSFVEHDPLAESVGALVNFEARGTSGLSTMFQTSGDAPWLADVLSLAQRPAASSLYSAIYELLPNDTDLTVFATRSIPGFNFAFFGDPTRYHTPLDDLAHLDSASLQHQGDNGLTMLLGLAEADIDSAGARGQAVFFDVLGLFLAHWPESWAIPLAVFAVLLAVAGTMLIVLRDGLRAKAVAWGLASFASSVVTTLALAASASLVMDRADITPRPWVAHPGPTLAAFALLGAALPLSAGHLLRRAGAIGLWSGAALGFSLLALVVSILLPGASYLFLVPALSAGAVGALLHSVPRRSLLIVTLAPTIAAAIVWLPVLLLIYSAIGVPAAGVAIALGTTLLFSFAVACVPELPTRPARSGLATLYGSSAIAVLGSSLVPHASPSQPVQVRVVLHRDADTARSRWIVSSECDALTSPLREAARFGHTSEHPYPWSSLRAFVAEAPETDIPPPEAIVLARGGHSDYRRVQLHVSSKRGATEVDFYARPSTSLAINGNPVPSAASRGRNPGRWLAVTVHGVPPEGLIVTVDVTSGAAEELIVGDRTFSLANPTNPATKRSRNEVTTDDGDHTFVTRRVVL
jgi:hypothetical protein